jgi:hypothetical protein
MQSEYVTDTCARSLQYRGTFAANIVRIDVEPETGHRTAPWPRVGVYHDLTGCSLYPAPQSTEIESNYIILQAWLDDQVSIAKQIISTISPVTLLSVTMD